MHEEDDEYDNKNPQLTTKTMIGPPCRGGTDSPGNYLE